MAVGVLLGLLWVGCSPQEDQAAEAKLSPAVEALLDEVFRENAVFVESEIWEKVSVLSLEEIQEAIEAYAIIEKEHEIYSELACMLFYRWAQADPVAAHRKVDPMYPKQFASPYVAVITAWINQGGEAEAWAAIQHEAESWHCTQTVRIEVAEMIASSFNNLSHSEAFQRAVEIKDQNCLIADFLCQQRSSEAWKTAESRAAFFAAAKEYPNSYVLSCARRCVFIDWAKADPEAAKAEVARMNLTEKERESLLHTVNRATDYSARFLELAPSEGKPWHELKQRLLAEWNASPDVEVDYELRQRTRDALEKAPLKDLEGWVAEPMKSEGVDDHRNAPNLLREFVVHSLPVESYPAVIPKLFAHEDLNAEYLAQDTIYHWMERNPASIVDWLKEDRRTASWDDIDEYREDALLELAEQDRQAFDERIKTVDPKLRTNVLEMIEWRARKAAD